MKEFKDRKYCAWCGERLKTVSETELICSECGTSEYNNPRAAVATLIINDRGQLLVATRSREPGKGMLDLPGGFIDGAETPEEAALREVKEETGIDINANDLELLGSGALSYDYKQKRYHVVDFHFFIQLDSTPVTTPDDDVESIHWLDVGEIDYDKFFYPGFGDKIKSYLVKKNML